MMHYYEEMDFGKTVYTVDASASSIDEHDLAALAREYAETTTTPMGVGTRMYTDGCDLRSWGPAGNNDTLVHEFENEEQADHALLLCHLYDLENYADAPTVFYARTDAEACLAELLEDAG